MKHTLPPFHWPRFLVCFIGAPLLVTALSFWMIIPIAALIFGGPFYLIAGLPLAAWYLNRADARASILILLAMLASLLQIPVYLSWAWISGDWDILNLLPVFIGFGAGFALIWSGTFMLLYTRAGRAEPPQKGYPMHAPERAPANIPWHDLTPLSRWDTIRELTLPLPWLVLSWMLYASPFWPLGAFGSFMFFLCALRLNHEAIHNNLGLSRRGDSRVMHVLSALMLGSNHAESWCHMQHHKHAMGPEDHEGKCGHMTAWQVLRYGPRFPVDINLTAWRGGYARVRKNILRDWLWSTGFVALALLSAEGFLLLHVAAMICAQCLAAFFAVWLTHQGLSDTTIVARSQRGPLAKAAYLMFYHREHHLFPKVPVSRLPELAARLDRDAPGYAARRKPVVRWMDPFDPDAKDSDYV